MAKFRIGLMQLSVSEVTMLVNAPPMIIPIAMSMTFPRRANALNSAKNFLITFSFLFPLQYQIPHVLRISPHSASYYNTENSS